MHSMFDDDFLPALVEIINSEPPINMIDDILQSLETEIYKFDQSKLDYATIAPYLHHIYVSPNPDVRTAVLYLCRKLEECSSNLITETYMFDYLVSQSLGQKTPIDLENSTDYQLPISSTLASSDHIKLNRQNSQVTSLQSFHKIHHIFNCYNNLSIQDTSSNIIDKEKLACFKYIETLIFKKGGYLPSSIVRSLVSLYESKYQWHNECKPTVLELLAQASVNFTNEQKYLMPSVLKVFSSYLLEDSTNMTIPSLFAYSIENNLPIIYDDLILMNFFLPLSNFSLFVNNKKGIDSSYDEPFRRNDIQFNDNESNSIEKLENAQQALIFFLRTWPGLLYFGIKNKAIEHLMICMPYRPKVVVRILKSLLSLKENTSSVTDGYSGFLLAELLKLGFIEKLNQECSSISQNQFSRTNGVLQAAKPVEGHLRSSFSLFSYKLAAATSATSNVSMNENNEIIEECENFINELLPFTSHCSTGDPQPSNPIITPKVENKSITSSFQRSSFLNSDSDLEFYNMSSLLNLNGDEYSTTVTSAPINSNISFKLNTDETFSRMIDVAQVVTHKSSLKSVNDVLGKKKDFDYTTAKWTEIQILLTVVLPYDQSEAKASSKLYTSMLNFLASQEFSNASSTKRIEMFEPYCSLIDLLLNGKLEENYFEDNTKFKEVIRKTIKEITHAKTVINQANRNKNTNSITERSDSNYKKSPKTSPLVMNVFSSTSSISPQIIDEGCFDMNSSKWFIFKLLMRIMSSTRGIKALKKWNLHHKIARMGKKIVNSQIAESILGEILFYPDSSLSIPTFLNFLSSYDENIHKSALSQLRVLRRKLPNFHQICFKPILIQHIKEMKSKSKSLFSSLNFLGEIISTDEASLITVCEDIDLIRIIFNNSHPIFSLLLSREETKRTWDSSKYGANSKDNPCSDKNISLVESFDSSSTESNCSNSSFVYTKGDRHGRRISKENLLASFSNIKFDEIIDREIRYWMDFGNLAYYRSFNTAVDAMFSDTLEDAIKKQPAIFLINGCAQPPPHLFGQLPKLKEGLEKLTPFIKELVDILVSLIDDPNFYTKDKSAAEAEPEPEPELIPPIAFAAESENENAEAEAGAENENEDKSAENDVNNSKPTFQLRKKLKKKESRNFISAPNSPPAPFSPHKRPSMRKSLPRGRQDSHAISRHTADESVCGILFALSQLGSVPSSSQIIEELGIVEKMIQAAVASPSYVIKGALISSLSLFAPSDYLSSVLQRYKWQKFRFGNRSCIIPRKPRSLFRETAVKKQNVLTAAVEESSAANSSDFQIPPVPKIPHSNVPVRTRKIPPLSLQSTSHLKTVNLARQPSSSFDVAEISNLGIGDGGIEEEDANLILSVVFDQNCIKKLAANENKENPKDNQMNALINFGSSSSSSSVPTKAEMEAATADLTNKLGQNKINRNLKIWINKLMASYQIENEARDLMNYLFQSVPLMELPENSVNSVNEKVKITAKFNQICISSKGLYKDKLFKEIKPLSLSIDAVKKFKPPFPEASLSEEELNELASISRKDFYDLDKNRKEEIRNLLKGI